MSKYKKKPVIVDAIQFRAEDINGMKNWGVHWNDKEYAWCVTTIHGHDAPLEDGDWIIREPDGVHFYPCKPDIFRENYEPLESKDE